jgi:hypothetical protein
MSATHEPRSEFVERLEGRIRTEVARRREAGLAPLPRWMPRSPAIAAAVLVAVIVISMGIGGGVVAATYQAQNNQQRELLAASYEERLNLARQKLALAAQQLQAAQQRVAVGLDSQDTALEARVRVAEADAEVRLAQLRLIEVRETAHEPLDTVSAPLVSDRDFVRERWEAQLPVTMAALDLEKTRLQRAQVAVSIGTADTNSAVVAQSRVKDVELALQTQRKRLDIRRQFIEHVIDASMAELRVAECEAEQRRETAMSRVELAKRQLMDVQASFTKGLASSIDVTQAQLRVKEAELDLMKATVDLTIVREQIAKKRD